MRHNLILVCLLGSAIAQAQRPMPSVLTYRTEKVAEGIYAFITPEERSGFQAGNSVAIVGDDCVLVFDTGNIPSATRRQIAEIKKLTDKPVRYVVNSHWHPDHNLGNAEYAAAFPSAAFISTPATRTGILERIAGYRSDMQGFATTDSLMRLRLASGKMRDGSDLPATLRTIWTLLTRDYKEFLPEVLSAKPLAPTVTFDDSLTIHLGKREVKIIARRANTEGDAVIYVPDAKVLLTGDLVTVPCPFPSSAFFSDWISALDGLKAIGASTIVPGHGDVMHDYRYVDLVREMLVFTRQSARDAVRKGISLDTLQKRIDFSEFKKRFGGDDIVRLESLDNFYIVPAVQRAYEEAQFLSQGPVREKP
jgi:cyclase